MRLAPLLSIAYLVIWSLRVSIQDWVAEPVRIRQMLANFSSRSVKSFCHVYPHASLTVRAWGGDIFPYWYISAELYNFRCRASAWAHALLYLPFYLYLALLFSHPSLFPLFNRALLFLFSLFPFPFLPPFSTFSRALCIIHLVVEVMRLMRRALRSDIFSTLNPKPHTLNPNP